VTTLGAVVGIERACDALSLPRATYYRSVAEPQPAAPPVETPPVETLSQQKHPRALTAEQKQRILEACASERFIDCAPAHIHAALLDAGEYIGSVRTIYRVLSEDAPLRDRRNQRRHPKRSAPELVATGPNRVWSWDITKLKGPHRGASYHLYVIIDIYSRYVVGWCVQEREHEAIARELIAETCRRQQIGPDELVIHADRGSSMRSKCVSELLSDLQVTRSHSRPYCSNDNPYSESQFKTLKYSSDFPDRFGSLEDARRFCREFFEWYNMEHRHSGIAMLTPSVLHHGEADTVLARRDAILAEAYAKHPERFVKGVPTAQRPPSEAWINKPKQQGPESTDEPSPVVNPERPEGSHGEGFSTGDGDRLSSTALDVALSIAA
jgi:putative transposase